jgi:hypothetical protein
MNLLDNTSGGKQILQRFKAAGSPGDRWLFRLATKGESGSFQDPPGEFLEGVPALEGSRGVRARQILNDFAREISD